MGVKKLHLRLCQTSSNVTTIYLLGLNSGPTDLLTGVRILVNIGITQEILNKD